MDFDWNFNLYCPASPELKPAITIELPPDIALEEFNCIAEKYGYMIAKEEATSDAKTEVYSFINLEGNNGEEGWTINKTEVRASRNNVVYLINTVFRVMTKPLFILKSMRTDPSWNLGWDRIARGAILKYFGDLPIELVDFYFDYRVNNFDKLARFIVFCQINDNKDLSEFIQNMRNYYLKLSGEAAEEKVISSNTKSMIITASGFGILMAAMVKGNIQAYNLFLLSHLEYCYPVEFKKGMRRIEEEIAFKDSNKAG